METLIAKFGKKYILAVQHTQGSRKTTLIGLPPPDTLYVNPVTPVPLLFTRQYKQQCVLVKTVLSETLTCIKYRNLLHAPVQELSRTLTWY
jgi:hypothetical protein